MLCLVHCGIHREKEFRCINCNIRAEALKYQLVNAAAPRCLGIRKNKGGLISPPVDVIKMLYVCE